MQSKRMVILGAAAAFVMALLLTLYPLISNYINQKYASEIHTSYQKAVEQAEDGILEQARKLAQDYNASIVPGAADSNAYSQEALLAASADYESQLNILGDGTMGYIQIPKINVLLPILHGTEADVLERGVGHLLGSSLPVGGESTHTVLTGHSGMASNTMFTDLELLEEGDVFYLQILNEVLAYRVLDINTVLPHESDLLSIVREEDLCTLVTCVPYGVNTHRLLVLGERIPHETAEQIQEETDQEQDTGSTWKQKYLSGLMIGLCMADGAAHMFQTSLPIGGSNTNCVIAGHRGYGGAKYFKEIDKLQVGDMVSITNLWETLHYKVMEIKIIYPDDVENILIQEGRELLTLLTCHPYASGGKQRYVVYCERVIHEN